MKLKNWENIYLTKELEKIIEPKGDDITHHYWRIWKNDEKLC